MSKRRKRKDQQAGYASQQDARPTVLGPIEGPLRFARALSAVILALGLLMLALGGGVVAGVIKEGWGFPMSAVPNWGKPWGSVLMLAGTAYVVGPVLLFTRPRNGSIVMLIVAGLSVIIGTPLIATTTEIFYNLFQETKSRPDWVDSVWGYFMIVNVAIAVSLCKAYPLASETPATANEA